MAVNYGQVAIVPKGEWNVETQYKVNNLVSYDGSSYVAKVQPPVGTLPTDTSYWQVSAAGTKKATADSLGTVMPDGTTTSVGEDGKLSVNTAQQDALGVVKGSDDITVGEDGTLTVNTTFEQATELANIIAGEAIKSVLGKVSKAIATTMSLDENALLKNMISGIDVNDSNKVPSSAYIHTLVERIGMGTELVSGLGDLTTGLNTINNNLSNAGIPTVKKITDLYAIKKSGFYCYDAGASNAPMSSRGGMIVANYLSDSWISLTVVPYALSKIYTNTKYNNMWVGWAESATKDDLPIIGKFTNKKNKDIIKIGSVVKSRSAVCVFPRYNTLTTVRCIYPSLEISAGEDQFQLFAWDTNTQNDSTSTNLDGYYIVMPMLSK